MSSETEKVKNITLGARQYMISAKRNILESSKHKTRIQDCSMAHTPMIFPKAKLISLSLSSSLVSSNCIVDPLETSQIS